MITPNGVIDVVPDRVMMIALGALINVVPDGVINVIPTIVVILDLNRDRRVALDGVRGILVQIQMKHLEHPALPKVPVVVSIIRVNLNKLRHNQPGVPVAKCGQKTQLLATHRPDAQAQYAKAQYAKAQYAKAQYAKDLNLHEVPVQTLLLLPGYNRGCNLHQQHVLQHPQRLANHLIDFWAIGAGR